MRFKDVRPEMTIFAPDSGELDEFHIELNDLNGGNLSSIFLAAGKTKRTTINKAIRTLKRLTRELEKELSALEELK